MNSFERGMEAFGQGDYGLAHACFSEAIEADGSDAKAHYQRGLVAMCQGDFTSAIADCTAAIQLDPSKAAYHLSRGSCHYCQGDLERAIADASEAIRLDPQLLGAYVYRGSAYEKIGRDEQALADFNEAIRLDPSVAKVHSDRGWVYVKKHEYDQAIADGTRAIHLDPIESLAYTNRAAAHVGKGDYDQAITDCTEAIRLNPHDARPFRGRARAYQAKGETDRAIAGYTEAHRLEPNDWSDDYNRAMLLFDKGDYEGAIAAASAAIELNDYWGLYYERGRACSFSGQFQQAIVDMSEVIRLEPNDRQVLAWTHFHRGWSHAQLDETDRARDDFAMAIQLDPKIATSPSGHESLHKLEGEATVQALLLRVAASRGQGPLRLGVQGAELIQRQGRRKQLRIGATIGTVGLALTVLFVLGAKTARAGSSLFGLYAFGAVIAGVVTMMVGRGLVESFFWVGTSGFRGRVRAVLLSGAVFWLLLIGVVIAIVVWIAGT